jgi:hypothetical protein
MLLSENPEQTNLTRNALAIANIGAIAVLEEHLAQQAQQVQPVLGEQQVQLV